MVTEEGGRHCMHHRVHTTWPVHRLLSSPYVYFRTNRRLLLGQLPSLLEKAGHNLLLKDFLEDICISTFQHLKQDCFQEEDHSHTHDFYRHIFYAVVLRTKLILCTHISPSSPWKSQKSNPQFEKIQRTPRHVRCVRGELTSSLRSHFSGRQSVLGRARNVLSFQFQCVAVCRRPKYISSFPGPGRSCFAYRVERNNLVGVSVDPNFLWCSIVPQTLYFH